jgi:hypothetical protein
MAGLEGFTPLRIDLNGDDGTVIHVPALNQHFESDLP